jgi:4-amino-4-deoxy-L-arabinose transferase-like glycosyltransferase
MRELTALYVLLALALAVFLDVWLLRLVHHYLDRRRSGIRPEQPLAGAPRWHFQALARQWRRWLSAAARLRSALIAEWEGAATSQALEVDEGPSLPAPVARFSLDTRLVLCCGGTALALFNLPDAARILPPDASAVSAALAGIGLIGMITGLGLHWQARQTAWLEGVLEKAGAWWQAQPVQVVCLALGPLLALTAAVLAAEHPARLSLPSLPALAWALGIGAVILGGRKGIGWWPRKAFLQWDDRLWLIGLTAAAFLARAIDTSHIPVILTGDEGAAGLSAVSFIAGRANNPFSLGWKEFPALYFFLQSLSVRLLGQTIPALRLPSALAGTLTVVAVYLVGRVMFGQRAGLVAAALLAAAHFHVHFSRIALNNIWDGLGFTITLGALWYGWQTRRRGYFLLAGFGLGFTQYFYLSSRVLVLLVAAWWLLAGWFDRARRRATLPHLLLLALVVLVVVLPLAWYYGHHLNQLVGTARAQSIFGPWLAREMQRTGLTAGQLLEQQFEHGFLAYTAVPLRWFYRPNTPILRPLSACWFYLGLLALVLHPRDPRFHLLGLWLLAFGLVGSLSESAPAAQRYVASAPAVALVAGLGLVWGAALLTQWRPQLARLIWTGALALLAFTCADDLRFYFREYLPNSHYRGRYDFVGYGSAVSARLVEYLQRYPARWQVQFFGAPRLSYFVSPSIQYLLPQVTGFDMPHPWGSPENPQPSGPYQVYVFLPGHQSDLEAAQAAQPGGKWVREIDARGDLLYDLYQVPAVVEAADPPPTRPAGFAGWPWAAILWPATFLLVASAFWKLLRRRPSAGRQPQTGSTVPVAATRAAPPYPADAPLEGLATHPEAETPKAMNNLPGTAPPSPATPDPQPADPPPEAPQAEPTEASRPLPAEPADPAAQPAAAQGSLEAAVPISGVQGDGLQQSLARVHITVEVPPGATVQVTVSAQPEGSTLVHQQVLGPALPVLPARLPASVAAAPLLPGWRARLQSALGALHWRYSLATTLFGLAGLLFLVTRLVGLADFPVYFFTDEAIQTNLAADFITNNFRDRFNEFLPTYFVNGNQYNLSLSVYAQVLPYLLFGKSVEVTRLVSVLIALAGTLAVGLTLRDIFEMPYWWCGTLLLSITPAWFLHSRTAFETAEATALYAIFLYYYLLYRYRAPRYLYPALIFGALTFYTYSPAQLVMGITGGLLLVSDWRHHWENRRLFWRALALSAVLALPYVRFIILHPDGNTAHLKILHSYWVDSIPLSEKLRRFFLEYRYGLSLGYWFVPNQRDLVRHVMKDYGHLLRTTLPFIAIGLGLALWRSLRGQRAAAYRALVIALLATPAGGALAEVGITRVLALVVPAALLAALGLWPCLGWLERRGLPRRLLALGLFGALALANLAMTRDALANGPTWFSDYTLGGLQYGARQVFGAAQAYLKGSPGTRIIVSPNWANGADEVARFFLPDPLPLQLGSIEAHMFERLPLDDNTLFVMMANEYRSAADSGKFKDLRVEQTLLYPDGQPGFLFVRLRYADNIDAILESEKQARRQLLTTEISLDDQPVQLRYSRLDMGEIQQVFDGNTDSLIRSLEANPLVLELTFPQPRSLSALTVRVGGAATQLTARLQTSAAPDELVFSDRVETSTEFRDMRLPFGLSYPVERLVIEVKNANDAEPAHVHVWEITFEP